MKTVNVYQMVTDRIVEQLTKGVIPWQMPWTGGFDGAINYVSRKPYSPLNQMLLGQSGEYLTFKQVKELGGSVKKGAKSKMVVFFTMVPNKRDDNAVMDNDSNVDTHPVLRYYNVFHLSDTTGIESKLEAVKENNLEPIQAAENIINGYLAKESELKFHNDSPSDKAYYSPKLDMVVVPMLSQYRIAEEYYSTVFHELVHSTSKESRCNRKSDNAIAAFRSADYSREELVAEIGSAMLCQVAGFDCDKAFNNSIAYIQGWLKVLRNDNKAIVWASSRAEKAAIYIQG